MATLFNAGLAGALLAAKRAGRLPERIETRDVILLGTASHKLSRLLAKDKITTVLRAPFTRRPRIAASAALRVRKGLKPPA